MKRYPRAPVPIVVRQITTQMPGIGTVAPRSTRPHHCRMTTKGTSEPIHWEPTPAPLDGDSLACSCTSDMGTDTSHEPIPSNDTSTPTRDTSAPEDTGAPIHTGSPDDTGTPVEPDFSDIDALINGYLETAAIPAVGAALMVDGEVVWANGYGWADIENEIPQPQATPPLCWPVYPKRLSEPPSCSGSSKAASH